MKNNDYRYQLDSPRVTGRRQQKATCPQCGRKRCFVRYVDTQNQFQYLNEQVGRCDHEQSCGYHYKPAEYFRDHPWLSDIQSVAVAQQQTRRQPRQQPPQPPRPVELLDLDFGLVTGSHSELSTFWQWLSREAAPRLGATPDDVKRVFNQYLMGCTRASDVIFWQIDHRLRVHTGHIMCYGQDGHRLSLQNWVHARLQEQGRLPSTYQPPKCLFGEHLLASRPQAPVAIVESEKTALVMALKMPEFLWVATAGCGGLSPEKLAPLQGRKVLVFPDSGCYDKWHGQLLPTKGLDWRISKRLEQYPPNTDLADLVLD